MRDWFNQTWLWRTAAFGLAIGIAVLSLVPPGLRPETDIPHDLEHFAIYFVMGMAFYMGFRLRFSLLALAFIAYAAVIEIAQMLVPGRHARLSDFIVDATASCLPLLVVPLTEKLYSNALGHSHPRDAAQRDRPAD